MVFRLKMEPRSKMELVDLALLPVRGKVSVSFTCQFGEFEIDSKFCNNSKSSVECRGTAASIAPILPKLVWCAHLLINLFINLSIKLFILYRSPRLFFTRTISTRHRLIWYTLSKWVYLLGAAAHLMILSTNVNVNELIFSNGYSD